MQYTDHYGNDVRHFNVLPQHNRLSVVAISEVLTPYELRDNETELSRWMHSITWMPPTTPPTTKR